MKIIILENVRSSHNVGSVFRIACATLVDKLILVGYTPKPIDRMGRDNEKLLKTSLGTVKNVDWEYFSTTKEAIEKYKEYTPVVVEQTAKAKQYDSVTHNNPMYIFGNEVDGVETITQKVVMDHISLPILGKKESLNVATCVAVVIYNYISSTS